MSKIQEDVSLEEKKLKELNIQLDNTDQELIKFRELVQRERKKISIVQYGTKRSNKLKKLLILHNKTSEAIRKQWADELHLF